MEQNGNWRYSPVITLLFLLLYNTASRKEIDQEFVQEVVPNIASCFSEIHAAKKENNESGSIQR